MSPKITEEKPSGDYDTITYYRYVEKNKEKNGQQKHH